MKKIHIGILNILKFSYYNFEMLIRNIFFPHTAVKKAFSIINYIIIVVFFAGIGAGLYSYIPFYVFFEQRCEDYRCMMKDLNKRSQHFRGDVAILVKDLLTNETVKINSDKLYPSASLVKIPIMAAVFEAQREGKLNLSDKLVLKGSQKVYSRKGLYRKRAGKKFTIRELVERMIITSDNTATNVLVDALGFGYINQKFTEFGLKDTDLRRGIMELKWRKLGIENYTTAEDMTYLLEQIYHSKIVDEESCKEMLDILKRQKINDRIPYLLPTTLDIAHKTGTLDDTISDVGIIFTPKGDFIVCVLTQNIRSLRMAKKLIRNVAADAYSYY
ncbi:MAG: class A beta-lactamase-related serine hydrolase [Elusimicrobia bacterium]|nr:class A beta-lactamase-related serine hydrolase [Candidatus Liberimonas magnetica]